MDFKDKKVLVCGLGRSGYASALLLESLGASVTAQDVSSKFKDETVIREMERRGIGLYLGKSPDDIVEDAELIVISPGIPSDLPFVQKAAMGKVPVWGEIELAYRLCPCPVIAITGTNGKTTTTAMVGEIMKGWRDDVAVLGNIGIPFTERIPMLRENSLAIAEISSFQLETTLQFRPTVSAVLNITPDHLNRHKTVENYQAIKEKIFENQREEDFTVLNYDDERCRDMARRTRARVVFFSRREELSEGVFLNGDALWIRLGEYDGPLLQKEKLPVLGNHNLENALAASAIALCAGAPASTVRKALSEFQAVEHRIEFVRILRDVVFYNDSKGTNTDAAIKSIEAMERPVVLIGGGYDKDVDFSGWVKMFPERVKHLVVLGETAEQIIHTCKAYNYHTYDKVNSLKDAVALAFSKAKPGDCVLLSPACASWDMFDDYEQRGRMFKEFVMELQ